VLFGVKDEMSLVRALFTNWFKTSIKKSFQGINSCLSPV